MKTFTITYVKEPFFKGFIIFGLDFKDKFRPLSFTKVLKDGTKEPVDPKIFKGFLFSEKNQFVAFPTQSNPEEYEDIRKMLLKLQYNKDKIINLTFCNLCKEKNIFNILNKNQQIKSTTYKIICPDCAYIFFKSILQTHYLSNSVLIDLIVPCFYHSSQAVIIWVLCLVLYKLIYSICYTAVVIVICYMISYIF